tara:strand:+ start:688 stop:870 length:183 start_codon:yes stop_codon:yes gene_type:complete
MAIDPQQKLEALKSELQQIGVNYEEAKQVAKNCEVAIYKLQGGIAACEEIIKPDEPATES